MASTRQKDIFDKLKEKGFEVYFPGQHIGDVKSKYIVVRQGVTAKVPGLSTMVRYYDIMIYVPEDNVPSILEFAEEVQKAILDLSPMIKFNNSMQAPYFDDTIKGYMLSMEYISYFKFDSDLFQKLDYKE